MSDWCGCQQEPGSTKLDLQYHVNMAEDLIYDMKLSSAKEVVSFLRQIPKEVIVEALEEVSYSQPAACLCRNVKASTPCSYDPCVECGCSCCTGPQQCHSSCCLFEHMNHILGRES